MSSYMLNPTIVSCGQALLSRRHGSLPNLGEASELEWNFHKDTIKRLYLAENNTLEQLQRTMEAQHGFFATKAQYERHFRTWNVKKKLKKGDWQVIGCILGKRKRIGKASDVYINDIQQPPSKVQKETSRNCRVLTLEQWHRAPTPPIPDGVNILTPRLKKLDLTAIGNLPYARFDEHLQIELKTMLRSSSRNQVFHSNDSPQLICNTWEELLSAQMPEFLSIQETLLHHVFKSPDCATLGQSRLFVRSIMPEMIDQDAQLIGRDAVPGGGAVQFLKLVIFLMSNNFLLGKTNVAEKLFDLLQESTTHRFIESLLSIPGPSTESLAENLFRHAVASGNGRMLGLLLGKGLSPNEQVCFREGSPRTPLVFAIESSDLQIARQLIAAGANINGYHDLLSDRPMPLYAAISGGDPEIVRLLVGNGALDNSLFTYRYGKSVLQHASSFVDIEIITILLDAGADVKYVDKYGGNCLLSAIPSKLDLDELYRFSLDDGLADVLGIVQKLLHAGVALNCTTTYDIDYPDGSTAVEKAASLGSAELIKVLLEAGATLTKNTLYFATVADSIDLVRFLLQLGADPNGVLPGGQCALTRAIGGTKGLVDILLLAGANVNPTVSIGELWTVRTPLQEACLQSLPDVVRSLLGAGAKVNAISSYGSKEAEDDVTALSAAAGNGCMEIVELLLEAGADVNSHVTGRSTSALVAALKNRHEKIALRLLRAGASAKQRFSGSASASPLQAAILGGNADVISAIMAAGADIDEFILLHTREYQTPLTTAIEARNLEIVHRLLDLGVDINNPSARLFGRTALEAATAIDDFDLVQSLLAAGAEPNDPQALLAAVTKGSKLSIISSLLTAHTRRYGGVRRGYGGTALHLAVRKANMDVIKVLIKGGVDINAPAVRIYHQNATWRGDIEWGQNALGVAICRGSEPDLMMISKLIKLGADPNVFVVDGHTKETALVAVITRKQGSVVDMLLRAGANVNAPAVGGMTRTALQAAVETGNFALVQQLLAAGANANDEPATHGGITSLQAAAIGGYVGIACLLMSQGAKVDSPAAQSEGRTALEGAAEHGRIDMLQMLLDAGADLHGRGQHQYERALKFASRNGHCAARRLLKAYHDRTSQWVVPKPLLLQQDVREPADVDPGPQSGREEGQRGASSPEDNSGSPHQFDPFSLVDFDPMVEDSAEAFNPLLGEDHTLIYQSQFSPTFSLPELFPNQFDDLFSGEML